MASLPFEAGLGWVGLEQTSPQVPLPPRGAPRRHLGVKSPRNPGSPDVRPETTRVHMIRPCGLDGPRDVSGQVATALFERGHGPVSLHVCFRRGGVVSGGSTCLKGTRKQSTARLCVGISLACRPLPDSTFSSDEAREQVEWTSVLAINHTYRLFSVFCLTGLLFQGKKTKLGQAPPPQGGVKGEGSEKMKTSLPRILALVARPLGLESGTSVS